MSLKEFIEDYKYLLGSFGVAMTTIFAWFIGRKGKKAETGKMDAEKEDILFNTEVKRDKFYQEKLDTAEKRIEILMRKLDDVNALLDVARTNAKQIALLLQQANSELTIYKMITAEKNLK